VAEFDILKSRNFPDTLLKAIADINNQNTISINVTPKYKKWAILIKYTPRLPSLAYTV